MYPYVLSEANKGRITFNKAVELCSTNPAKLFGLDYAKGALEVGLDADIVLYDPKKAFTITNKKMHGATDHTIWEGAELRLPRSNLFQRKTGIQGRQVRRRKGIRQAHQVQAH